MPVSITEIVFHGSVNKPGDKKPDAERSTSERQIDRDQLIEDTVAEVMRLLRRERER